MGLITIGNTFTAGTTAVAAEVNANFSTIANEFNGSISNANIAAGAAIALSKLSLSSDATFTGDVSFTNTATTDDIVTITGNSLTTGSGLKVTSSSANTSARKLIQVVNDGTAASATACIDVDNDSSGPAINLTLDGNGPAIRFGDSVAVTGPVAGDVYREGTNLRYFDGTTEQTLSISNDEKLKAWISFNGGATPAQINDSFNVASVGDIGTGDYIVYWDTNFADTTHAVMGMVWDTGSDFRGIAQEKNTGLATSSARFTTFATSGATKQDCEGVYVMAVGDQ